MEETPIIRHNQAKDGIEILFSNKPDFRILTWLKSNRYNWSMRNRVWYRRYSPSAWEEVTKFFDTAGDKGETAQVQPGKKYARINIHDKKTTIRRNVLRDELAEGKMVYAMYSYFDGMTDSTMTIPEKDLVWSDTMDAGVKRELSSDYHKARVWSDDGVIRKGDYKFKYKDDVIIPEAHKPVLASKKDFYVNLELKPQYETFDPGRPDEKDEKLYNEGDKVEAAYQGRKVCGTIIKKTVSHYTMRAVFGGATEHHTMVHYTLKLSNGIVTGAYQFRKGDDCTDIEPNAIFIDMDKEYQAPDWVFDEIRRNINYYHHSLASAAKRKKPEYRKSDENNAARIKVQLFKYIALYLGWELENMEFSRQYITGESEEEQRLRIKGWREDLGIAPQISKGPDITEEKPKTEQKADPDDLRKPETLQELVPYYYAQTSDFRKNQAIEDFAYLFAGDRNKLARQRLLKEITGIQPPVAKAGISVISAELHQWIKKQADPQGSLKPAMSLDEIAEKHNYPISLIKRDFLIGTNIEKEHTNDQEIAEKIAKQHLEEDPQYYTKAKPEGWAQKELEKEGAVKSGFVSAEDNRLPLTKEGRKVAQKYGIDFLDVHKGEPSNVLLKKSYKIHPGSDRMTTHTFEKTFFVISSVNQEKPFAVAYFGDFNGANRYEYAVASNEIDNIILLLQEWDQQEAALEVYDPDKELVQISVIYPEANKYTIDSVGLSGLKDPSDTDELDQITDEVNEMFEGATTAEVDTRAQNIEVMHKSFWNHVPDYVKYATPVKPVKFSRDPDDPLLARFLDNFVEKTDYQLKPVMTGVRFDKGHIVATNSHQFIHLTTSNKASGTYCITNTCLKKVDKKNIDVSKKQFIPDYVFPKWEAIIPEDFKYKYEVDLLKLKTFCEISIRARVVPDVIHACEFLYENKEERLGFNGDYIINICDSLMKLGWTRVQICVNTNTRPTLFIPVGSKDTKAEILKNDFCLLMPVLLQDAPTRYLRYSFVNERIYNVDNAHFDIDTSITKADVKQPIEGYLFDIMKKAAKKSTLSICQLAQVQNNVLIFTDLSLSIKVKGVNLKDGLYLFHDDFLLPQEFQDPIDGSGRFEDEEEYPFVFDDPGLSSIYTFSGNRIRDCIKMAEHFVAKDEIRPVFQSAHLVYDEDKKMLLFAVSDASVLMVVNVLPDIATPMLLPELNLTPETDRISKIFQKHNFQGGIEILYGKKSKNEKDHFFLRNRDRICIRFDNIELYGAFEEYKAPNFISVLPAEGYSKKLTIKAGAIKDAAEKAKKEKTPVTIKYSDVTAEDMPAQGLMQGMYVLGEIIDDTLKLFGPVSSIISGDVTLWHIPSKKIFFIESDIFKVNGQYSPLNDASFSLNNLESIGTFAGQVPAANMQAAFKENTPIKEVFDKAGEPYPEQTPDRAKLGYFTKSDAPGKVTERFGIAKTDDISIIAAVPKTLDQTLPDGMKVYIVDGKYIRDNIYSDFAQGGNDMAYPEFVPIGELWIEKDMLAEKEHILKHEKDERNLMLEGKTYEQAHEIVKEQEDSERGIEAKGQKQKINQAMKNDDSKQKIADATKHLARSMRYFLSKFQYDFLKKMLSGEESDSFADIIIRISRIIESMPGQYETEKVKSADKIVYLHYFSGASDFYIIEKDKGDKDDITPGIQRQAFGYAILNGDLLNAEWGYVDIQELIENNVELDFYWEPKKFSEIEKTKEARAEEEEVSIPISVGAKAGSFADAKIGEWQQIPALDASYKIEKIEKSDPMYVDGWRYEMTIGYPESLGENGNYDTGNFFKDIPSINDIEKEIRELYEEEYKDLESSNSGRDENIRKAIGKALGITRVTEQEYNQKINEERKIFGYSFEFTPANDEGLQLIKTLEGFGMTIEAHDYSNGIAINYKGRKFELIDNSGEFKINEVGKEGYPEVIEFKNSNGNLMSVFNLAREIENVILKLSKQSEPQKQLVDNVFDKGDIVSFTSQKYQKTVQGEVFATIEGNLYLVKFNETIPGIFNKKTQQVNGRQLKLVRKGTQPVKLPTVEYNGIEYIVDFKLQEIRDPFAKPIKFTEIKDEEFKKLLRMIRAQSGPNVNIEGLDDPEFKLTDDQKKSINEAWEGIQNIAASDERFDVGDLIIPYALNYQKGNKRFLITEVYVNDAGEESYKGKFETENKEYDLIRHSKDKLVKKAKYIGHSDPKSPVSVSKTAISVSKSDYKNDFELNKAIESLLDKKWNDPAESWSADELEFLTGYSGYGGLDEYGQIDKGSLFEFYTPEKVIEKMWGLAYKYGYKDGRVIEPSAGIGLFLKREFVKSHIPKDAYEINKYSARICKLLYPEVSVNQGKEVMNFEQLFIKNNYTVRNKVTPQYSLVIGNPPYGEAQGLYMGMGEKTYTKAKNYIDYFIFRGLDLLIPGGLLIYIIGAEVAGGGVPWLDQGTSKCKEEIIKKGKLIDAYRLPEGLFARTNVVTDIVVFRKR